MSKKDFFRLIKVLVALYLLVGVGLYFTQELFLFHPKKLDRSYQFQFNAPFRELNIKRENGTNLNMVQFLPADSQPAGIVLYYHGNMRNINRYAPFTRIFTANGYEVWMMDYPGFGKTTGKRSEKIMYEDAEKVYQMAAAKIHPDSIIVYGKSIGTGLAAHIAARYSCKRLVLETPYFSIPSLASRWFFMYPVNWLIKYRFPTGENLPLVKAPVTIFHGTKDELIPYKNALRLAAGFRMQDEFVTLEGATHNNIYDYPQYHAKLDSLLGL